MLNCQPSCTRCRKSGKAADVLRVEELEAVASRMAQLGSKLQKCGAASAAVEPMRVSRLAAHALLRRCHRLQAEHQVNVAPCASNRRLYGNVLMGALINCRSLSARRAPCQ